MAAAPESDLDIRYVADLARITLTDDEAETFGGQLEKILGYVKQLESLDVSGIEPTAHAAPRFDIVREDEVKPSIGVEATIANAPKKTADQFLVTKVVE